jgi:hypothetical protein
MNIILMPTQWSGKGQKSSGKDLIILLEANLAIFFGPHALLVSIRRATFRIPSTTKSVTSIATRWSIRRPKADERQVKGSHSRHQNLGCGVLD